MDSLTCAKAHYDGRQIVLDGPLELLPDTPLIVMVLSTTADDRVAWNQFSASAFTRAYAETEPEYTAADLKTE